MDSSSDSSDFYSDDEKSFDEDDVYGDYTAYKVDSNKIKPVDNTFSRDEFKKITHKEALGAVKAFQENNNTGIVLLILKSSKKNDKKNIALPESIETKMAIKTGTNYHKFALTTAGSFSPKVLKKIHKLQFHAVHTKPSNHFIDLVLQFLGTTLFDNDKSKNMKQKYQLLLKKVALIFAKQEVCTKCYNLCKNYLSYDLLQNKRAKDIPMRVTNRGCLVKVNTYKLSRKSEAYISYQTLMHTSIPNGEFCILEEAKKINKIINTVVILSAPKPANSNKEKRKKPKKKVTFRSFRTKKKDKKSLSMKNLRKEDNKAYQYMYANILEQKINQEIENHKKYYNNPLPQYQNEYNIVQSKTDLTEGDGYMPTYTDKGIDNQYNNNLSYQSDPNPVIGRKVSEPLKYDI